MILMSLALVIFSAPPVLMPVLVVVDTDPLFDMFISPKPTIVFPKVRLVLVPVFLNCTKELLLMLSVKLPDAPLLLVT